MDSKSRIQVLDSLRGIAALAVLLFHYSFAYSPSDVSFVFRYGYLGVHLFFIVSGFVIYMTIEKTKYPSDFIVSRFSRLFPAYWVAILLTSAVMNFAGQPNEHVGFFRILGNFTMCQRWLHIENVDGVYWTLTVELTFYVFMFLVFISKKVKYIFHISIILLVFLTLIQTLNIPLIGNVFPFFKYSNLFISGMCFYKIKNKEGAWYYHVLILGCILVQALIASSNVEYAYILVIFIVFYLFTYNWLEFLNNKLFLFFGSISYSLYLIHENIGILLLKYLERFQLSYILRLSIVLSIVIFVAFLITKFIENPAMNFIRSKFRNKYSNEKKLAK